jgi:hypothetical protein
MNQLLKTNCNYSICECLTNMDKDGEVQYQAVSSDGMVPNLALRKLIYLYPVSILRNTLTIVFQMFSIAK